MIETARPGHGVSAATGVNTDLPDDVAAGRAASVVAVIDTVILSGPGRQLVAQAVLQQSRGTAFRIVTFRRAGRPVSPFVAYAESRGVACDVIEETGRLDMSVLPRVREAFARAGATVVQTHGYRPSAIVRSLRALGWYRGGWVGFYHGATAEDWKVRLYDALDRRLLRSADQVVVMSRPQLALFEELGARAALVFNAVLDEGAVSGAQGEAPLLPPTAVPRLAAVGRLSPEKGVDVLLEAAAMLKAQHVPFELLLAGDGPERSALEAQAAALSLGDTVRFMGQVHDVGALYRAIDLLVIPSRSEGLPNVLLEALRHGRFAVSTRVGAVPDVLEGSRAGIIVPPEDPRALADAIARALVERDAPGVADDRAAIIARFSLASRVQTLEGIHARVLPRAAAETR